MDSPVKSSAGNDGVFPEIQKSISETRFQDALKQIESERKRAGLVQAEQGWLESNYSMCLVGAAAVLLGDAKKEHQHGNAETAKSLLKKCIAVIEPHFQRLNLDASLARQMIQEMHSLARQARHDQLEQAHRDRDEIIQAIDLMLPDSLGSRALKLILDAEFHIGLIDRAAHNETLGDDLEGIKRLLEAGEFEKALQKIDMERLRRVDDANYQEHLDWSEKAALSILVLKKYKAADPHFEDGKLTEALALYREVTVLMEGKYRLFQLNEDALPAIIKDFQDKVSSGAISSYEDTLVFRNSYMQPLKQKYGDSPDWQVITMVLDAHIALRFFTKLNQATDGKAADYMKPNRKKKRSLLSRFLRYGILGFFLK